MNLARRFDSPQSREMPWVLIAFYFESIELVLRSYPNKSKLYQIMDAYGQPMRQKHWLNAEKEVITNRNPLGSHAVHQAVTEKKPEAPGRLSSVRPPGAWPREASGPPPCGRLSPHRAAGSCLSLEPILWKLQRKPGCAIT